MHRPRFLERAGDVLFRWRSFTPVPLIALAIPLVWMARGPASPLWLFGGIALCLLGQVIRIWVLGQVPDGTSGQNELLIADSLNTTGPYAHTRNPLYLGNFLVTLGLCLVAHSAVLLVAVIVLFAIQYRAIIAAEERFLRGQFGASYDAWTARVPRFWPRMRAATSGPARPFDARRALRKEHNPAAAWLLLAIVLHGLGGFTRAHALLFAVVVAAWLSVKAWKHRWLSGNFGADLRRRIRETAR